MGICRCRSANTSPSRRSRRITATARWSSKPMRLILHNLEPMHWLPAGLGIAGIMLALLFVASRRLGVSSVFEDVCSLVLRAPYFARFAVMSGRTWRFPLLVGLVLGGFLSAVLGGGWEPTWALGMFDRVIGLGPAGQGAGGVSGERGLR